tara:strand:+ start:4396 stop:4701 length:306 start_codon:yes stop_codon:yes gene_type:complete
MNRYKYIIEQRLDDKRKRLRYNSSIPPTIAKSDKDVYIISRDGDRLDNLAFEYFEDQSMWWVIAQANHLGKGTFNIEPGIRIRIPSPMEYYEILKRNETER